MGFTEKFNTDMQGSNAEDLYEDHYGVRLLNTVGDKYLIQKTLEAISFSASCHAIFLFTQSLTS